MTENLGNPVSPGEKSHSDLIGEMVQKATSVAIWGHFDLNVGGQVQQKAATSGKEIETRDLRYNGGYAAIGEAGAIQSSLPFPSGTKEGEWLTVQSIADDPENMRVSYLFSYLPYMYAPGTAGMRGPLYLNCTVPAATAYELADTARTTPEIAQDTVGALAIQTLGVPPEYWRDRLRPHFGPEGDPTTEMQRENRTLTLTLPDTPPKEVSFRQSQAA